MSARALSLLAFFTLAGCSGYGTCGELEFVTGEYDDPFFVPGAPEVAIGLEDCGGIEGSFGLDYTEANRVQIIFETVRYPDALHEEVHGFGLPNAEAFLRRSDLEVGRTLRFPDDLVGQGSHNRADFARVVYPMTEGEIEVLAEGTGFATGNPEYRLRWALAFDGNVRAATGEDWIDLTDAAPLRWETPATGDLQD